MIQTVTLRVIGPQVEQNWPLTPGLIRETVENLNDLMPWGYVVDVVATDLLSSQSKENRGSGKGVPCS